jgi:hypothetical protein
MGAVCYNGCMGHDVQDAISLEIATRIAEGLREHPEWIDAARANLDRWTEHNCDAPGLLKCYYEWREILERPVEDVRDVLLSVSDEGQRLRQNSPFAGVLGADEVRELKRRHHESSTI